MQFRLPSNLQTELIAYDPVLKKLARNTNPKLKTKKSTYPLGNPKGLIPVDVVRESMLDDAIKNISSCPASDRHQKFTRIVNGEVIVTAILYHYEQCWYAAWLPPKGQEDKYVYGYAFAFKDTKAAHDLEMQRHSHDAATTHLVADVPAELEELDGAAFASRAQSAILSLPLSAFS